MHRMKTRAFKVYFITFAATIIALSAIESAIAQSGPRTTPEIVTAAAKAGVEIPSGPFEPNWDSIKAGYKVPQWWQDAKFVGLKLN